MCVLWIILGNYKIIRLYQITLVGFVPLISSAFVMTSLSPSQLESPPHFSILTFILLLFLSQPLLFCDAIMLSWFL